MSSPPIPAEERFFKNVLKLGENIHQKIAFMNSQGVNIINPAFVAVFVEVIKARSPKETIETFIKYSYPYWDAIHRKDKDFFKKNADRVFSRADENQIQIFQRLLEARLPDGRLAIDEKYTETLWKYFEAFVRLSLNYIRDNRLTQFPINLQSEVSRWGL